MTLSGAALETGFILNRGREQSIKEVRVVFANAAAGNYVQLFRKATASTSNEQDDSHADSLNVLVAEGYFVAGDLVLSSTRSASGMSDMRAGLLRIRINSAVSGTAYINIVYDFI